MDWDWDGRTEAASGVEPNGRRQLITAHKGYTAAADTN